MRESFVLRFKNLPKAKYDLLKEFLAQVKVGSVEFEWTHPDPTVGTVYIVKIVSISPFQFTIYGYSGEITIRGVKKNA
ncbi:MAG: hypothetical protein N2491_01675 [Negativicutes bacterium]|nr:hypothetical protein [Negativicutes bacterium]